MIWFGVRIKISVEAQQAGFWLLLSGKFIAKLGRKAGRILSVKRLAEGQAEETKAGINSVCP